MYQSQIQQNQMQMKMIQQQKQQLAQQTHQHPNFRTHQEDINRTNFHYNNNNNNNNNNIGQRFINQNYQRQEEEYITLFTVMNLLRKLQKKFKKIRGGQRMKIYKV